MTGAHATARKEEITQFIEDQLKLGGEGPLEQDLFCLQLIWKIWNCPQGRRATLLAIADQGGPVPGVIML